MDFVHGQCPGSPWIQWTLFSLPGHCPGYQWTKSTLSFDSIDIVQGVHGQCPGRQSTLSTESMRLFTKSMGIVQSSLSSLPGLCPECPCTLSRLSTDSMYNVQGVHGHCPGSPWIQWTFYRGHFFKFFVCKPCHEKSCFLNMQKQRCIYQLYAHTEKTAQLISSIVFDIDNTMKFQTPG